MEELDEEYKLNYLHLRNEITLITFFYLLLIEIIKLGYQLQHITIISNSLVYNVSHIDLFP